MSDLPPNPNLRTDPRPRPAPVISGTGSERDILPKIALPSQGLSATGAAVAIAGLGLVLFLTLDANRRNRAAPDVGRISEASTNLVALPDLIVPPEPEPQTEHLPQPFAAQAPPPPMPQPMPPTPPSYSPQPAYNPPLPPPYQPSADLGSLTEPALVVDQPAGQSDNTPRAAGGGSASEVGVTQNTTRVIATLLHNKTTTIAPGTLIRAILETPIDTTRPGLARAIISHDTFGFDGKRVLIPRGSRLIGEFRSDTAQGQKRALILWTQLIRPDGAMIRLESPSGDALGGAGIAGKVDSHFLERFGGAIFQTIMTIGVNSTGNARNNNAIVVALPGAVSNAGQSVLPTDIAPTLKVRQGTVVTIFVAHELDFSTAETLP